MPKRNRPRDRLGVLGGGRIEKNLSMCAGLAMRQLPPRPVPNYRTYWERNIDAWSDYYLDMSHGHETLSGPAWFSALYRATIGRHERRLMRERYKRTVDFLDAHAKPGITISDLGCGTGIFVVEALKRGAAVNAVDFAASALDITCQNVAKNCPEGKVTYHRADVQTDALPTSDITLAMGVTPYLADLPGFMGQVLPKTKLLFCLYVDPKHLFNRVRVVLPFLNVRGLQFYARQDVDWLYAKHGWKLKDRRDFASGYIDLAAA